MIPSLVTRKPVYNYTAPLKKFSTIIYTTILRQKAKSRGRVIHKLRSHLLNCGKSLEKRGKLATMNGSIKQGSMIEVSVTPHAILITS
jgi:hypothetical protein